MHERGSSSYRWVSGALGSSTNKPDVATLSLLGTEDEEGKR